jgi:hypothetical protein
MTESGDWTIAIGCKKAALHLAVRTPLALATCWGGFWLLLKFIGWMSSEINQEITNIDMGLIVVIGIVAGVIAGQILSRKLVESTGLVGTYLLAAACIPLIAGLWALQQIVGSTAAEWTYISWWLFCVSGIAGCIMAWWQIGLDS